MLFSKPVAFLALLASQVFAMPAPASEFSDVHPSSFENDDSHALDILARTGYPKMPTYVFKGGTCSTSLGPQTERGKLDDYPDELIKEVEGEIHIPGGNRCLLLGCSPPKTSIIVCSDNRGPIVLPVRQIAIAIGHVTRACFKTGMGIGVTRSGGNWNVSLRGGDNCPKARFLS